MDAQRFVRQILVDGIGEAGQRAIGEADAPVAGPAFANEVASLYALAAGFGRVVEAPGPLDPAAPEAWVTDPSARAGLAGARAALRAITDTVAAPSRDNAAGLKSGG